MSTSNEIEIQVAQILNTVCETAGTEREASFSTVPGWDSIRQAQLAIALQRRFAVRFSINEIVGLTSLAKVTEIIFQKLR